MRTLEELADVESPFEPGRSPYCIKGMVYRGHLDFVEGHVPGGVGAMMNAIVKGPLHDFLSQPFLASNFYDIFPLAQSGILCAKLCGEAPSDFVRHAARQQARAHIKGVYRFLLQFISSEAVAQRLPKVRQQYLSYGKTTTEVVGPKHIRGQSTGVPRALMAWSVAAMTSYFEVVLELSGAREPAVGFEAPVSTGADGHGVELVSVLFDLRWK